MFDHHYSPPPLHTFTHTTVTNLKGDMLTQIFTESYFCVLINHKIYNLTPTPPPPPPPPPKKKNSTHPHEKLKVWTYCDFRSMVFSCCQSFLIWLSLMFAGGLIWWVIRQDAVIGRWEFLSPPRRGLVCVCGYNGGVWRVYTGILQDTWQDRPRGTPTSPRRDLDIDT